MSFIDEKSTTPKLLKNGFLVKKGGAKDSLLESWQKRWFTLKYKPLSETHEIEYFKNNNSLANPLGLIVLSNKCSVAPSTRKECCLSLMTPDREYFFCAKDHVEMEEWRKAIMEAINNSRNNDTTLLRSYSSSAFFTRTSTESISDEEEAKNNTGQNPPVLHPPNSPSQTHSSHSSNSSSPVPSNHSSTTTAQSTSQTTSNGESHPPSSPNAHTTNLSKRLAENKQVLEEFPFLMVSLEELKWSDVPKLLEQYKRMALTTLVKENRI